jgi:hypothetical protein
VTLSKTIGQQGMADRLTGSAAYSYSAYSSRIAITKVTQVGSIGLALNPSLWQPRSMSKVCLTVELPVSAEGALGLARKPQMMRIALSRRCISPSAASSSSK